MFIAFLIMVCVFLLQWHVHNACFLYLFQILLDQEIQSIRAVKRGNMLYNVYIHIYILGFFFLLSNLRKIYPLEIRSFFHLTCTHQLSFTSDFSLFIVHLCSLLLCRFSKQIKGMPNTSTTCN